MDKDSASLRMIEWLLDKAGCMPHEVIHKLARGVGRVWYRVDGRHRRVAIENLRIAFGDELDDKRREALCRMNFEHLARVMLEVVYLGKLCPDNVAEFADIEGAEHIDKARAKGKGVLGLTSHFGNWELMALASAILYHPVHVVVRPLDHPLLDRLVVRFRSKWGNRVIPKEGAALKIFRLLKRGELVALLMDQNAIRREGVFAPFFNKPACTNKSLAMIALRSGSPVVPISNFRRPDGRYTIMFEPEVPIVQTGDMERDCAENTARFNKVIERQVRLHPEQWFWLHERWRTRPSVGT
jgi:Kdo2-lipid IVA lauroyltransferase/acyltransferase